MSTTGFDLAASARQEMLQEGFRPDFSAAVRAQVAALHGPGPGVTDGEVADRRDLLWSSIDNDSSRDLDQIEYAERVGEGIRVSVGIADVDAVVQMKSPIDEHAGCETTSVYTPVWVFPMLPEKLSTDLTSLSPGGDRLAVVIEMLVDADGALQDSRVYRALVRNKFQLTYSGVGDWLEGSAAPPAAIAGASELQAQLKLQDEAASRLRRQRDRLGALNFDRVEARPVAANGSVKDIVARRENRAGSLIEDFMVAANEVMAQTLRKAGVSNIRRVVKAPERWPRIVELAGRYGVKLPQTPDSGALANFLQTQKQRDAVHYPDLSLGVLKLMGSGEYALAPGGDATDGHFGLAAQDYTHSTAPNRRFADLVTQRLIKAVLSRAVAPYSDEELGTIARTCTVKEDAARKVERTMNKRAAAVAFRNRVGESFEAVVTGVTKKGVFVRVFDPPIEGRLMRGEQGVDVGDPVRVTLLSTDPARGFIDFGRYDVKHLERILEA